MSSNRTRNRNRPGNAQTTAQVTAQVEQAITGNPADLAEDTAPATVAPKRYDDDSAYIPAKRYRVGQRSAVNLWAVDGRITDHLPRGKVAVRIARVGVALSPSAVAHLNKTAEEQS